MQSGNNHMGNQNGGTRCVIVFKDEFVSYFCGFDKTGSIKKSVKINDAKIYEKNDFNLSDDIVTIITTTGYLCGAQVLKNEASNNIECSQSRH